VLETISAEIVVSLGHLIPKVVESLVLKRVSVPALGVARRAERSHIPHVVLATLGGRQDVVSVHQNVSTVVLGIEVKMKSALLFRTVAHLVLGEDNLGALKTTEDTLATVQAEHLHAGDGILPALMHQRSAVIIGHGPMDNLVDRKLSKNLGAGIMFNLHVNYGEIFFINVKKPFQLSKH
jgi:hypothetical protein